MRLGKAKQLLPWRGKPFIWHVVNLAIRCKLSPVIVVTGSGHETVVEAVVGLPVLIAHNIRWREGQSSSIRKGLMHLPDTTAACLFLLCDQPQIPQRLVNKIVSKYLKGGAAIIAPCINGIRGNPVLFDHSTFSGLKRLKANDGGRLLFDKYAMDFVEWDDKSILIDVDTEESYQQLLKLK
jgi:molybdenum cofactor cytidylyltransferase